MVDMSNVGSVAGGAGSVVNFVMGLVTGFLSWLTGLPAFIKVLFVVCVVFVMYIVWEFNGKILSRPKPIEV